MYHYKICIMMNDIIEQIILSKARRFYFEKVFWF